MKSHIHITKLQKMCYWRGLYDRYVYLNGLSNTDYIENALQVLLLVNPDIKITPEQKEELEQIPLATKEQYEQYITEVARYMKNARETQKKGGKVK